MLNLSRKSEISRHGQGLQPKFEPLDQMWVVGLVHDGLFLISSTSSACNDLISRMHLSIPRYSTHTHSHSILVLNLSHSDLSNTFRRKSRTATGHHRRQWS